MILRREEQHGSCVRKSSTDETGVMIISPRDWRVVRARGLASRRAGTPRRGVRSSFSRVHVHYVLYITHASNNYLFCTCAPFDRFNNGHLQLDVEIVASACIGVLDRTAYSREKILGR